MGHTTATSVDVIAAIASGAILVDPELGTVRRADGKARVRVDPRGYGHIQIGNSVDARVHHVVWVAVHGALPEGMVINHRNLDTSDNRIANLEATTQRNNVRHARAHAGRRAAERRLAVDSFDPEWLARVEDLMSTANVTAEDIASLSTPTDASDVHYTGSIKRA